MSNNVVKMMPIKRKNPKNGRVAWYLQKTTYDTIGKNDLVDAMARNTGISKSKVSMAVDAIVKQLKNFLLNGHSVTIDGLGTFTPRVSSRPSEQADEVSGENVKALRLKFRPTSDIRTDYRNTVGYSVIDYSPTEPDVDPAPADPMIGLRKVSWYSEGEWHEQEITAGTTTLSIPNTATAIALNTEGTNKGYYSIQSAGAHAQFSLKKAVLPWSNQFDYMAKGIILNGTGSFSMYYHNPNLDEPEQLQGVTCSFV